MTDFIDEPEFKTLSSRYAAGDLNVHMPRQIARQFFLTISNQEVKRTTGKSIIFKKALIWSMNIASPVAFLACLAFIVMQEGAWTASLIIPVAGICWTVIYSLTSEHGGWLVGTIPLILAGAAVYNSDQFALFLFVLSLWLQRTSYLTATIWLTDILMNSFDAFEMMQRHLSFDDD